MKVHISILKRAWGGAGAAALGLLISLGAANAQSFEQLKANGKIVIGIQGENPPWGFVDENNESAGFDADFAKLLGEEIGVPVEFTRVAVANRIPTLMTNKVDALIAVMGMYPDRAKVVQFTKPYSAIDIILLAKPETNIATPTDLNGLRIAVARASAQDTQVTQNAPQGATIQRFDDDATAIQAFLTGQVDALGANNTYFLSMAKIAPDFKFEKKLQFNRQYNGISVRPGQKPYVDELNTFIDKVRADGRLEKIYQKWLGQDMPEFPDSLPNIPFTVQ
ncbi:ABC transporter substrate-binding protein [Phyllobacterium brassicacearum]|uniref:ABC transporter substrate-binding protein n=1 Tax=Phyllobacterium brassicacearum TaxID=314235 RepID=A0A2P7B6G6_9HYPH|nr:transporter substrate-binding domain-containing protein [Phyllobacterium brassicacearum]PSH62048.1 ABC transporter substrate-binding protein [Phyllobacterium brassicacearum]TDQ16713.1 amino acid ABC transporter substrate-binding protein (PAAT family) [Phyllobacterium brassicacearum]